jgi:tetratricopeptide (TPR) repeat protein
MRAAVSEARRLDAKFPEAIAYLDALSGEIAFHEGNWAQADRLATEALSGLPREEALLRWRTQAWQAEALRRMGRIDAARPLYHEVLQKFPPVLRYLELRVPATISDDGSALARRAARRLAGSARFATGAGAPFRLAVAARNDAVEICLTDDSGFQFSCATGEKKATEDDTIASALDAFHAAAFSPRISLKQSDLNSLDGSPVRVGVDEVLKGVVEP